MAYITVTKSIPRCHAKERYIHMDMLPGELSGFPALALLRLRRRFPFTVFPPFQPSCNEGINKPIFTVTPCIIIIEIFEESELRGCLRFSQ